jgi:hypothetical protein
MHDTKERLSLLWIFALLNYLYADVVALFASPPGLGNGPRRRDPGPSHGSGQAKAVAVSVVGTRGCVQC